MKHVQIDSTAVSTQNSRALPPCRLSSICRRVAQLCRSLGRTGRTLNAPKDSRCAETLRDRVGMPEWTSMKYKSGLNYPFRKLNKYVQAVRHERRVEQKACEGRRLEDILR